MLYSDYLPSPEKPVCLSAEEWQAPKAVIRTFFESYDFVHSCRALETWLKKARSNKALPHRKLAYTYFLYEELLRLLEAITLFKETDQSVLPPGGNGMESRWWPGRPHLDHCSCDRFPRHLRSKAFHNPYIVFDKCRATYSLIDWRNVLRNCWLAGMTPIRLDEVDDTQSALKACCLLPQLLEAAYLVYVREMLEETIRTA